MFNHMTLGSNDLARSKTFYDALLAPLDVEPGTIDARGRLIYRHDGLMLMLTKPQDGAPATVGHGSMVGFRADNPGMVDAWYAAGTAHGGVSVEDAPGQRNRGSGPMYVAYLHDPDGHKLCAVHYLPR